MSVRGLGLSITLAGDRQLVAQLRRMGNNVNQALKPAVMAGALIFQNAWKRNIVSMRIVKTGTYLRSVQMEVTSERPGFVEVTVGTDIVDPPYPEYQEFGTSRIAARPAARTAWDASKLEVETEIIETLRWQFR